MDWAHVSCALWIPAIMFEDPVNMELITGRNAIPLEARVSLCDLCRIPQGITIKCCINGCKGRFHVTCAYDQGLVMDIHSVDAHVRFFVSHFFVDYSIFILVFVIILSCCNADIYLFNRKVFGDRVYLSVRVLIQTLVQFKLIEFSEAHES